MRLNELSQPVQTRQLFENFNQAIHTFNATELKLEDIFDLLENNGYHNDSQDRDAYLGVAYGGWSTESNQHWYYVAVLDEDADEDDYYLITKLFVELNKKGKLAADFSSHPVNNGESMAQEDAEAFLAHVTPQDGETE